MFILPLIVEPVVFFSMLILMVACAFTLVAMWAKKENQLIRNNEEVVKKMNQSFSDVVTKSQEREEEYKRKIEELQRTTKQEPVRTQELAALRGELEQLKDEIQRLTKDGALKEKLYEGLKAQYNELEKSSERLIQQIEDEKRSQRLISQKLWDITKIRGDML
jgi:hypothetical protein